MVREHTVAYTPNWRAVRRFLDARAERAAGRARDTVCLVIGSSVFPKGPWHGVLAKRAPPLRAAAERSHGRERVGRAGPRRVAY